MGIGHQETWLSLRKIMALLGLPKMPNTQLPILDAQSNLC